MKSVRTIQEVLDMAGFFRRREPDTEELPPPEVAGAMLAANPSAPLVGAFRRGAGPAGRQAIGKEEIAKAIETLTRYKQGKRGQGV